MEHIFLLMLLAVFLFDSPLTDWLFHSGGAWYLPYLAWLLIIIIAAMLHFLRGRSEH